MNDILGIQIETDIESNPDDGIDEELEKMDVEETGGTSSNGGTQNPANKPTPQ